MLSGHQRPLLLVPRKVAVAPARSSSKLRQAETSVLFELISAR
jgi:hypothetical protein